MITQRPAKADTMSFSNLHSTDQTMKPACEGTLVGGFFPELTWFYSCCPKTDLSCAGCGLWAKGKCTECAPGFTKQNGVCVICDDIPGWTDDNGLTCSDYERNGNCSAGELVNGDDLPNKGLRASQACCSCGGGEPSPTPWRYPINNEILLFGEDVKPKGRPAPRTARRHEVQADCGLVKLGLSLQADGSITGVLPQHRPGEGSISESCTVAADQDEVAGLEAEAELRVTVQPMSYGPKVIVVRFPTPDAMPTGQLQWDLRLSPGLKLKGQVSYEANCMPAAPWIAVDGGTGSLSYVVAPHEHGAGLSGAHSGFESTQCLLTARDEEGVQVQSNFAVIKAFLWAGAYYPSTVFARKGRPIAGMQLWREAPPGFEAHTLEDTGRVVWVRKGSSQELSVPPAMRPEVQGVKCTGAPPESPVKWSRKTGLVTIGGQEAFVVDPRTGDISGTSKVDLPARLGRASLTLSCAVALSGELYDYSMTVRVGVQIEDDTCWYEADATESVWAEVAEDNSTPCSLQCLARPDCGLYWHGEHDEDAGRCYLQSSMSSGSGVSVSKVYVRTACEEGVSCLELKDSSASFLEGRYCPRVRQMVNRCFRPTFHEDEAVTCNSPGFIMYSMRTKKRRFGGAAGEGDGHFVCVYTSNMKWFMGNGEFIPEPTDVLVALVDLTRNLVTSLAGTGDVLEGVRKGFASGDIVFAKNGAAITVTGKGFLAWECGDVSTAVFSREGINAWDEFYMARGPCPIHGRGGNWVIRRANESDYMNPEEGSVELRGDVLACIDEDVERGAFKWGVGTSTMWMPASAFSQDYYAPEQRQNNESALNITVSLVSDACSAPDVEEAGFIIGTASSPSFHSLDVCECFGEDYRNEEVVTADSRKAVQRDPNAPFNKFHPEPQLILEGPYRCEDGSVLEGGQRNEVSEDQCSAECYSHRSCRFFTYVGQLRYCTLHRACERIGHTGLDITHRLFGIFDQESSWCRIADPEACWAKKHRRALLTGHLGQAEEPCAFQDIIAQCDVLQMATTEAHGTCRKCEYYPTTSAAAQGLVKKPLPAVFPGGSQLSVGCEESARLLSFTTREQVTSSMLTCVGGKWVNGMGKEGFEGLSCVDCVQVSQPSYTGLLLDSAPEVYFLSRRQLQYHYGVASPGCHLAGEATAAPLRSANGHLCLEMAREGPVAGQDCPSWYLTADRHLRLLFREVRCLTAGLGWGSCDQGAEKWHADTMHRIRSSDGRCLVHGGEVGAKPELEACSLDLHPPAKEQWYFDGGDCRYSMHLRGTARPLTWRFELHGGAVLGRQSQASGVSSSPQDLLDPMAYGTCAVNIQGGLTSTDPSIKEVLTNIAYEGPPPEILGARGMMFTVEDRTLFVCSPGGEGGAEKIKMYQAQKAEMEGQGMEDVKKLCGPIYTDAVSDEPVWGGARGWSGLHWHANGTTDYILSTVHSVCIPKSPHGDTMRNWQLSYRSLNSKGIRPNKTSVDHVVWTIWTSGGGWDERASTLKCPEGFVVDGMRSEYRSQKWGRRRRRGRLAEAHEWRPISLRCVRLGGQNPHMDWTPKESDDVNVIKGEFSYTAPDDHAIVGIKTSTPLYKDYRYRFLTVKLCGYRHDKIAEKKAEIAAMAQKIHQLATTSVSCAQDLELPLNIVPDISVAYVGQTVKARSSFDLRCHLLHRGLDESDAQDDFTLTAGQLSSIARAVVYHAVGAQNHTNEPFEGVGAPQDAQNVGWFTMIDNGATIWGIHCERGSVVTVHSEVASPHCVSVGAGASQSDLVLNGVVPGSGQCDTGYAIGGWYNLPGVLAKRESSATGGPKIPTGFKIYCREVPGLSRLCEEKELRCEADEVVTGIQHELGLTVKYRCCKLPRMLGHGFAGGALRDLRPWEGYYCPQRIDETGRPEYGFCGGLGRETVAAEPWRAVPRATALALGVGHLDWAKHEVFCKAGEVLSQFKAERSGRVEGEMMRASYTCLKLPMVLGTDAGLKPQGCRQKATKWFGATTLKDFFSRAPGLQCGQGWAMAGFRLATSARLPIARYHFLCCTAHLDSAQKRSSSFGAIKTFVDVAQLGMVRCEPNEALQSFRHTGGDKPGWVYGCARVKEAAQPAANESGLLTWDKFGGIWKLWQGDWAEPQAALASMGSLPTEASREEPSAVRVEPPGYSGAGSPARYWLNKLEVNAAGAGPAGWSALALEPGARKVAAARSFELEKGKGAGNKALAAFLNGLSPGRVVIVALSGAAYKQLDPLAHFALQRCGSSLHAGQRPAGSYILVGVVGDAAIAESQPDAALEALVPQLSVAPIVDFTADFVMTVQKPDPFPKHRPLKPKLLHFAPKKPEYDQFCNLKKRTEEMNAMDCDGNPDACPEEEHPCAHTFKYKITEQLFWDCSQREIDRKYVEQSSEADQGELEAEGSKLEMIFDLVESGVELAAAAAGAVPWGSFAVPAEVGAGSAVSGIQATAKKVMGVVQSKIAKIKQLAAFKKIKEHINTAKNIYNKGKDIANRVDKGLQMVNDNVNTFLDTVDDVKAKGKALHKQAKDYRDQVRDFKDDVESQGVGSFVGDVAEEGIDAGKKEGRAYIDEKYDAVPRLFPPDGDGANAAKNLENVAVSAWNDCNPMQFGLSKMMCDLYCVEDAVKEGDAAILSNMRTSHTVLMTNFERLLDYHTQTLLWGMGQLRDQLTDAGSAQTLLFFPGKADREALAAGKLPDDVTGALAELGTLPKMLKLDLPANTSMVPEVAERHNQASQHLLTSLHRVLEKNFKPGGNVKFAARQAKAMVQRFNGQTSLEIKKGASGKEAPHLARMTQEKAIALREQIRGSQENLELATPSMPASSLVHQDPAVMAWYGQVSSGFVTAHERHAAFVQARQRALQAAEHAVAAAESYVSCGEKEGMKGLHGLWQRAYRLEDAAVKELLDAWTALGSAKEKLALAVQQGLVQLLAEQAPLPAGQAGPCGTLQALAERGHASAVRAVDKAVWPLLEQVLALARLGSLQEQELLAKGLSHVAAASLNGTVLALYEAATQAADPSTEEGKRLAARALNTFGPAACPAPASCRRGGMLLLGNGGGTLWTSATPGDLLLGKSPAEVAHACRVTDSQQRGAVGELQGKMGKMIQEVTAMGSTQSVLSVVMSGMGALVEQMKEMNEQLNEDKELCGAGCAELLHLSLTKKKSAVGQMAQRLR